MAVWARLVRPFAFSASLVPVFLAATLALLLAERIYWPLFPLVVICSVLFHAGTNVVSEYFDFKKGVDRPDTLGSSRVLVEGLEEPAVVLRLGASFFIAGVLLGIPLIAKRGLPMALLAATGLCGGLFYTAGPFGYKYLGLGDLLVFLLMGPLMVFGAYFALTGDYNTTVLLVSLPIGFLVTAILSSNNLRDISHDTRAGIRTLESLLGQKAAGMFNACLVAAAYGAVVVLALLRVIPVLSLLVLVTLPLGLRNMGTAIRAQEDIAMLDLSAAKLHLVFGTLLVIAIAFQALFV